MTLANHRLALLLCSGVVLAAVAAGCATSQNATGDNSQDMQVVRAVIEMQQAAWNRGDLEGFMEGYERADTTTFVSGDELTRGWQTVLDRYKKRYASREDMGALSFSDLEIQAIGSSHAVANGRWKLTRTADMPHGRFTLVFQRSGDAWRIIQDTTTSATP